MAGNLENARDLGAGIYTQAEVDAAITDEPKVSASASSVLLGGNLALANYAVTKNFATVTYTGNGSTQNITTGISSVDFTVSGNGSGYWLDRTTNQVKNDAGVVQASGSCVCNVSKVLIKERTSPGNVNSWQNFDGLRGVGKILNTDTTIAEATNTSTLSAFVSNGFSVGNNAAVNESGSTMVAYQTLYTHIKWGTTNQGKFYVEAYNPVTREGMVYYIGSGMAGHEIPHSQGVELDYFTQKGLSVTTDWNTEVHQGRMILNGTNAILGSIASSSFDSITITSSGSYNNGLNDKHITYYKAKSETWTIVQYQGTGASGNFVETKDVYGVARKPRRVIIKRTDSVSDWTVYDSERDTFDTKRLNISLNLSNAEIQNTQTDYGVTFSINGVMINGIGSYINASGGQYIALVEFDTNGNGGDSYFDLPTDDSNLNVTAGTFTYTNGIGSNGYDRSTEAYTGAIDFTGMSDGLKWIAKIEGGGFVAYDNKPDSGNGFDVYFDTKTGKQYIDYAVWADDFRDNNISDWSWDAAYAVSVADKSLTINRVTGGSGVYMPTQTNIIANKNYKMIFNVSSISAGFYRIYVNNVAIAYQNTLGSIEVAFSSTVDNPQIVLQNDTNNSYTTFDSFSIMPLDSAQGLELSLGTALTTPVSFLPNPIMVASETPMDIRYDDELSQNVADSVAVKDHIELDGVKVKGFLGQGQTWQNVTSERSTGITYTNNTGKPIEVSVRFYSTTTSPVVFLEVDGEVAGGSYIATQGGYGQQANARAIVPPNSKYKTISTNGTYHAWHELR